MWDTNDIDALIDAERYRQTHKQKTINGSLKLYLKQTNNTITIERDWVVEYKQEYCKGYCKGHCKGYCKGWLYWTDAADDAFRIMSIHYE